jgi:hypothetical protein
MAIASEMHEVDAIWQQQNSIPIDAFLFDEGVGDESRAAWRGETRLTAWPTAP